MATMMRSFVPMRWMIVVYLLVTSDRFASAQTTNASTPSTTLTLAASNPFRLVLRPTIFELDFVALSIVEEAMATAILRATNSSLVDVNINVNQMNWLSPTSDNNDELIDGTVLALGRGDVPTTVLKFFAVGTFLLKVPIGSPSPSGSLAAVKALDSIIAQAFREGNSNEFTAMLRSSGDPLLVGIQDADAIKTNSNETPTPVSVVESDDDEPEDEDEKWRPWDIILIAVTCLICAGILFIIVQHVLDRGYFEHQRQRALNERRHIETSSSYTPRPEKPDRSLAIIVGNNNKESEATSLARNRQVSDDAEPSHASSLYTNSEDNSFATKFALSPSPTDINTHLNSRKHRYSSKVRIRVESLQCDSQSLPTKPYNSTSSLLSWDDQSECKSTSALSWTMLSPSALTSEFGPINWFHKSAEAESKEQPTNSVVSSLEEQKHGSDVDLEMGIVKNSSSSSKSSSSSTSSAGISSTDSDVFQVGQVKTSIIVSGNVTDKTADYGSKSSSAVMTEWIKSIQVVASPEDSKSAEGSEVTCKESSEHSSTAENSSTEAPSVEDGIEDVVSLEHSMANSTGGIIGIAPVDDGSTMEF